MNNVITKIQREEEILKKAEKFERNQIPFSELKGKVFKSIEVLTNALVFTTTENVCIIMTHLQDCCEIVSLEDICGDLSSLINSPILFAEETSSSTPASNAPEYIKKFLTESDYDDILVWTFYKLSTLKDSVTLRWCGISNGYYAIDAELYQCI